jgi:hypothetical protein
MELLGDGEPSSAILKAAIRFFGVMAICSLGEMDLGLAVTCPRKSLPVELGVLS